MLFAEVVATTAVISIVGIIKIIEIVIPNNIEKPHDCLAMNLKYNIGNHIHPDSGTTKKNSMLKGIYKMNQFAYSLVSRLSGIFLRK